MINEFPIIKTNRFLLRQFIESDLENVFNGLSNPDVNRYYGVNYDTLDSTKAQLRFFSDLENNQTGIWWAICSLDNQCFYGAGGLNDVSKVHQKAEVGFWLLPEFWRNGIMKEVMPFICNYGFEVMNLHRIEGIVESENLNCKKAMSGLSFQFEGTMRDSEIKNGRYISLDIYALINPRH